MIRKRPLRVVMLAAEAAPYAKVGGLADVVGALPKALEKLGAELTLVIPAYTAGGSGTFSFGSYVRDIKLIFQWPFSGRVPKYSALEWIRRAWMSIL